MSVNKNLLFSNNAGVAEIRLNRPERLNAVTEELYGEFKQLLASIENDKTIRVVCITGEGRAFCVGADMKEHAASNRTSFQRRQYLEGEQQLCLAIQKMSKPVVAAVNGYALGAGAEIAVAADFILIKESAQIGFPEITIGTFLGGGVTHTLPRLIGLGKARELLFFGEKINGKEAERIGLANICVEDESFDEEVESFCRKLAEGAPSSMALAKEQLNAANDRSYETALRYELEGMTFCSTTSDWQEGVDAFKEKRKPVFAGNVGNIVNKDKVGSTTNE
jgi:enoyl-CoA hydratase